jgi:hypothetical protein
LTIAADAVQRANRSIGAFEGTLADHHHLDAMWAITEALAAIIHELDAHDREPEPTAAERQDMRQSMQSVQAIASLVTKAIHDGVDAVHRERERCAKLAWMTGTKAPKEWDPTDVGELIASEIRKVPE